MGLALQPAARRDLVDVAVNVLIDKHVDHPHRVVLSNVVIQILGKQNALSTDFTLDEARHLTPPARIIQNYNSTSVFTQPRTFAYMISRMPWTTSSPPTPRMAAPRISCVSASTTILMKPCVSPFSMARATLVIGRVPTRMRFPKCHASASVIPARPSGGS